ncbi:hypothetical protein, partial [Algoriphagus faecimaris]|uniref:hypothetical protein n=1 Tax=Algoriphagus faecimaris TaxID=686796 RepID=UPI001C31451E
IKPIPSSEKDLQHPNLHSSKLPDNFPSIHQFISNRFHLAGIYLEVSDKTPGQRLDRFHTFIPGLKPEAIQSVVPTFAGRQA